MGAEFEYKHSIWLLKYSGRIPGYLNEADVRFKWKLLYNKQCIEGIQQ